MLGAAVVALSISVAAPISSGSVAARGPAVAGEYVVKPGDFLVGIATSLRVSLTDLLAVNGLTMSSAIHPGQRLKVPAAPPVPGPITHTVAKGDFLSGIAQRYKVKLSDLLAVNSLSTSSVIMPGKVLKLPAGAVAPAAGIAAQPVQNSGGTAVSSLVHTVRSGDYLGGIAQRYKVRFRDLLSVNTLTASSVIIPGQQLKLPAGAVAPATGGATASGNAKIDKVLTYALAQVGKPYRFFTKGPNTFDCSGLSLAAYAQVSIALPHYSGSQAQLGTPVDWWTQDIKPGDLVFTARGSAPGVIGHLGIAISSTQWVQAPGTGDVVRVGPLPADYKILAVRRLIP
jgi:LysM repeat protein